ncbi:MAG: pyrroline-5-carboxylate reductase [Thermoanaerobacteraceae bacterium]
MKIGFIGVGNMGFALLKGILNSNFVKPENIIIYDSATEKSNAIKEEFKINIADNNINLVQEADIIILAIKPNIYDLILKEIKGVLNPNKLIITIAPGITIEHVKSIIKAGKVIRTIPNTPALIGEGITAIAYSDDTNEEDKEVARKIFRTCGEIVELNESLIDAAMAVSSCSPAFTYMFIEALSDAGVALGLPRDIAYKLSSKALSGSGNMVLKTGLHPGQLKDMVTSPGGTTIQGVRILEKQGMRSAVIEAVISSYQKAKE